MMVGWPAYHFSNGTDVVVGDGEKFGILPEAWTVFIEASSYGLNADLEQRKNERIWFFDANGNYQRWVGGRGIGSSLETGGLWVRLSDETSIRIDRNHAVGSHCTFNSKGKKALIPVEIHDDIGLGLFLEAGEGEEGDQLVVGSWAIQ